MYQIKSGKSAPRVPDILFSDSKLKDGIKACFEGGCTLVVAFTGWDGPQQIEDELARQSAAHGYADARIEVWPQNTIIAFLGDFPPPELSVKGLDDIPSHTHEKWSNMGDMKKAFYPGEEQRKFIDSMRRKLRQSERAVIRVAGDPGIGKTRMVLEATNTDDLRPAVIYFAKPSDLEQNFARYSWSAKTVAVLVVDECDARDQAQIWNELKYNAPNVRLVTVFTEHDADTGPMLVPSLQDAEIGKILKSYAGDEADISGWISWCSSSPRVAHVLGENIQYNPPDLLKFPNEVDVWGRYIAGRGTSEEKADKRLKILRWLSLFRKFGFESPHDGEADMIAKIVEREEGIPRGEFRSTIADLRQRKILQGGTTLYITPKLLHLYLWRRWWDVYDGSMFPKMEDLVPKVEADRQDGLLGWCLDMFAHGGPIHKVVEFAADFLAPGGDLESRFGLETPLGARAFLTFSKVSPASALDYLDRKVCKKSADDLLKFTIGRREVVVALERMVSSREHLDRAARVLLQLAEAENEASATNATSVFQRMFKPGIMPAEPDRMIRLLKPVVDSDSPSARKIGIGACNSALEGGPATFVMGVDDLDSPPQPAELTVDEVNKYRLQILDMLKNQDGDHG